MTLGIAGQVPTQWLNCTSPNKLCLVYDGPLWCHLSTKLDSTRLPSPNDNAGTSSTRLPSPNNNGGTSSTRLPSPNDIESISSTKLPLFTGLMVSYPGLMAILWPFRVLQCSAQLEPNPGIGKKLCQAVILLLNSKANDKVKSSWCQVEGKHH